VRRHDRVEGVGESGSLHPLPVIVYIPSHCIYTHIFGVMQWGLLGRGGERG